MKLILYFYIACWLALSLSACKQAKEVKEILKGGTFSGGSASQVALSKQARKEMCCPGITIAESTDTTANVHGCGEIATFVLTNDKWAQTSLNPYPAHGTAADKATDCSQ